MPNFENMDPNQFRSREEFLAAQEQLRHYLVVELPEQERRERLSGGVSSNPTPAPARVSPVVTAAEAQANRQRQQEEAAREASYCKQPELHRYSSYRRGDRAIHWCIPAIIAGVAFFMFGGVALGVPQYNFDMMWNGGGNVLFCFCLALSAGIIVLAVAVGERIDNRAHRKHVKTCRKQLR